MKQLLVSSLLLSVTIALAQPDTEVYLLDINDKDGQIELSNLRNISNNEGYDNQPSFYDDNTVLFASTRNGQTDIAKYNIRTVTTSWLTSTAVGSEYSPTHIPGSEAISAVRLDTTGYQRLYRYDLSDATSKEIFKDLKVGYHVWYSDKILVTTVLLENRMDLVVSNLEDGTNYTVQKNVGRALHHVPNTESVSYVSKEEEAWSLKSLNPITGATKVITSLPANTNDVCWLPDGSLLIPNGKSIRRLNLQAQELPKVLHRFEEKEINNISRMAVSPNGKHLALVSEASPALIVQKQVESFNAENLDAFAACYAENVIVRNFPNDTISMGNKALKTGYERYFDNNPKTTVEVVKRIQLGKVVIDEEVVTKSGRTNRQAAIYEVSGGKIASMTFVHEKAKIPGAEAIIDKNLTAYRARDIDAFLSDYTQNVEVYMFPHNLSYTGKEKMRAQYADFLKNAEGLTCEIKNRMVVGNIVIDEEYLSLNGNTFSAVAIYEIEDGKIAKVTFIQ